MEFAPDVRPVSGYIGTQPHPVRRWFVSTGRIGFINGSSYAERADGIWVNYFYVPSDIVARDTRALEDAGFRVVDRPPGGIGGEQACE